MKKVFLCVFIFVFLLSGCSKPVSPYGETTGSDGFSKEYIIDTTTTKTYGILSCDNNAGQENEVYSATGQSTAVTQVDSAQVSDGKFMRGVWLSYYEINVDNSRNTPDEYASYITHLCSKFQPLGITDVFVQVRPYADALYKSNVYPTSVYAGVNQGGELIFDPLEIICRVMLQYGIKVHAWVNPYRVHNGTDINELSHNNKARQWYVNGSAEDVAVVGNKIYFNPASEKAQQLVVEGVKEILAGYPVAGIHIDDYFYPPDCGNFDGAQYEAYLSQGGTLSLEDWRRSNVNKLVSAIYTAVKAFDGKVFSVSPAGNIQNNYQNLYADVSLWSKGGYADMIIPQVYFGFLHETHPFNKCVADWYSLRANGVRMPVGLALYKAGTEDSFAVSGKDEWKESSDIISRQVQYLSQAGCDGFVIFSCEFLLENEGAAAQEVENLQQYLNNQ